MGTKLEPIEATRRQKELLEMPSVSKSFPHKFEDTGFEMNTLEFTCGHCNTSIPVDAVRGNVSSLVKTILDMELMGLCPKCSVATPFRIRVHSNRTCIWQDETGNWNEFTVFSHDLKGVKESFVHMLQALRFRIFGG